MALAQYETLTQALLQAPSSPNPLIPTATLDTYINQARLQVAAQGLCVRNYVDLVLTAAQRQYGFTAFTGLATGVSGIYNVRQLWFTVPGASGTIRLVPRPFEYFGLYALNNPAPPSGQPVEWAQFGQGESGTLFIDPLPDLPYGCKADVLAVPTALVDDASPEAIPAIWTLAVPFYAAWLGFQSRQRQVDADKMMERFKEQMAMARAAADPNLLSENWQEAPDPMMPNRLNIAARG